MMKCLVKKASTAMCRAAADGLLKVCYLHKEISRTNQSADEHRDEKATADLSFAALCLQSMPDSPSKR
jgi:hypothetical protein